MARWGKADQAAAGVLAPRSRCSLTLLLSHSFILPFTPSPFRSLCFTLPTFFSLSFFHSLLFTLLLLLFHSLTHSLSLQFTPLFYHPFDLSLSDLTLSLCSFHSLFIPPFHTHTHTLFPSFFLSHSLTFTLSLYHPFVLSPSQLSTFRPFTLSSLLFTPYLHPCTLYLTPFHSNLPYCPLTISPFTL